MSQHYEKLALAWGGEGGGEGLASRKSKGGGLTVRERCLARFKTRPTECLQKGGGDQNLGEITGSGKSRVEAAVK